MRPLSFTILLLAACGPAPLVGDEVLVLFQDPDSEFETTDVHDVEREIVQFTEADQMVRDELAFPGWPARGNELNAFGGFTVRFGDEEGERRAFFTESDAATICDIEVEEGRLRVFSTSERVPSSAVLE